MIKAFFLRLLRYKRTVCVVASFVFATLAMYLEYKGFYSGLEGWLVDLYMSSAAPQSTPRVIAVTITKDDYRDYFKAKSPLPYDAVRHLIEIIVADNPAVLGVDILTETPEWADPLWKPWHKRPIVWAASADDARIDSPNFFKWLLLNTHDHLVADPGRVLGQDAPGVPSEVLWGLPVFPSDEDGAIRRLSRVWFNQQNGKKETTIFASVIADKACSVLKLSSAGCSGQAHEVTFLPAPPADQSDSVVGLEQVVRCQSVVDFECKMWSLRSDKQRVKLRDAIVLLGGAYPEARDSYVTTTGLTLPGVVMNANAVRLNLADLDIDEAPRLRAFLLDLLIGCLVGRIFHSKGSLRTKTLRSLAILPGAAILSLALLLANMLWVSWGVVVVSGLAWHVVWENIVDGGEESTASHAHP